MRVHIEPLVFVRVHYLNDLYRKVNDAQNSSLSSDSHSAEVLNNCSAEVFNIGSILYIDS